MYKSSRYFLSSFVSVGISIQEKKFKIYFQNRGHSDHLGLPIGTILATFFLQVAPVRPIESIDLSIKEKKLKIDFQNGAVTAILDFR